MRAPGGHTGHVGTGEARVGDNPDIIGTIRAEHGPGSGHLWQQPREINPTTLDPRFSA